jgi:hypothetical protein
MNGKGPKFERETIIRFDEESDKAEIWTASETVYRRLLKRVGRAYLTEDGKRHAVFTFPGQFLQLPRHKAKRTMSDSQKAALLAGRSQITRAPEQKRHDLKDCDDAASLPD